MSAIYLIAKFYGIRFPAIDLSRRPIVSGKKARVSEMRNPPLLADYCWLQPGF
jgi:hypothetical protein